MANTLSKTGVVTGQTIEALQVSQSVDAFTGGSAYDITISGSLTLTGSLLQTGSVFFKQITQVPATASNQLGNVMIDSDGRLYSGSSSVGAQGATGEKGAAGEKGETGSAGSAGAQGASGAQGAVGSSASYTVKQVLSTSTNGTQFYRYYQGPIDTGLSLTINCADANNKILIEYTICCAATTGNSSFGGSRYVGSRLLRNNSQIAGGTSGGSGNESVYTDTGHDSLDHHSFSYMDTPGAGNHTYKVQIRHHLSGSYSNYLVFNRSRNGAYRTLSTLTCSEIEI